MDSTNSLQNPNLLSPQQFAGHLIEDEQGVTAIEYALLASLIALVCVSGISSTGVALDELYTYWADAVLNVL